MRKREIIQAKVKQPARNKPAAKLRGSKTPGGTHPVLPCFSFASSVLPLGFLGQTVNIGLSTSRRSMFGGESVLGHVGFVECRPRRRACGTTFPV
jgi:hypothetical protein